MKYAFTRVVAGVEIAFGVIIIIAGTVIAALVVAQPEWFIGKSALPALTSMPNRIAVALSVFLVGLGIGATTIVVGQVLLAFLDILRRVTRIDRRQRRRQESAPPESQWTDRLRRR